MQQNNYWLHLCKKIEKENDELKEEMILCLISLVKDKEDSTCGIVEGLTNSLDGVVYGVSRRTHISSFAPVEMLTKPSPSKATIISEICIDEDVLFYWVIASANFEIDNAS